MWRWFYIPSELWPDQILEGFEDTIQSYSVPKSSHSRINNSVTKIWGNKYDLIVSENSIERHISYPCNVWCVFLFSLTWDWFTAFGDIIWKIKWLEEVIIGSLPPLGPRVLGSLKLVKIKKDTNQVLWTTGIEFSILIRTTPCGSNVQSIWCSSLSPRTRIPLIGYWDRRIG